MERDLERETMRRVGRRLLPFLFVLYVFNFLDRTNVGVAALQMNADLKFSAEVFGLGSGLFFVAYALCEVPSNLILVRIGPRRWIGAIMMVWGVIASAMLCVRTPAQFYALRLLLGVAEAGFFPGIIYYLGTWFPAANQARAFSAFTLAIPISQAIGAPVGGALLSLDGVRNLAGWQWLFLLEGLPSVVLGLIVFRALTDDPSEAEWLTDEQRRWLTERLVVERASRAHPSGEWWRALTNPLVYVLGIPWFGIYALGLAFIIWAPLLVRGALGTGNTTTALITGGIGFFSAAVFPIAARWSDRMGERSGMTAAGLFLGCVGCIGMALFPNSLLRIAALCVLALTGAVAIPAFWCMPTRLLKGPSAAAGIALINALGACGGFFGPSIIGVLKQTTGSDAGAFLGLGVIAACGVCTCIALRRLALFRPQREVSLPTRLEGSLARRFSTPRIRLRTADRRSCATDRAALS